MPNVSQILHFLEVIAPNNLAESWDNIGLLAGNGNAKVHRILCALDVTEQVVQEAIDGKFDLIVAHHPLIFTKVHAVTTATTTGRALIAAIKADVAVICMHTNLDCATGGVNDALASVLGLSGVISMGAGESGTLGRVGKLPMRMSPALFADYVKDALDAGGVRYCDGGKTIQTVAVGGGACGKLMDYAIEKGADAFVVGECTYDLMQKAQSLGLTLVDAGHFATENPIVPVLVQKLQDAFLTTQVQPSALHGDCILYV